TGHLPAGADLETWGPVGQVVGLWLHTAQSRAEWTHGLLRRLEEGAYRMAGDGWEGKLPPRVRGSAAMAATTPQAANSLDGAGPALARGTHGSSLSDRPPADAGAVTAGHGGPAGTDQR